MPAKTQREREAEQRRVALERIQEQVDDGSLVIRKMTEEERASFERKRRERPVAATARRARPGRGSQSASPSVSRKG